MLHKLLRGSRRALCFLDNKIGRVLETPGPPERQAIIGFQEFCLSPPRRRALLSYLVEPVAVLPQERDTVMFSNRGIAQYIPRALNELGYSVDIVNYDWKDWRPGGHYDLFIGHGGVNFEHISRLLNPVQTVQIYFSTGTYWRDWNTREARRFCDLAERRGHLLPPDRAIRHSEEFANSVSKGIICLGNQEAVNTYRKFPLVIGINNGVFPISWDGLAGKDFAAGSGHFLFFSGDGNVHKGLDLLLEAFSGTPLHLHICQNMDPHFVEVYREELYEEPNIHLHGPVPMRSPQFESLAASCNWVISATCAEGQPGAVLECMGYGLIPVLPVRANIGVDDFGLMIQEDSIEDIRTAALEASRVPPAACRVRARSTRESIRRNHSPERFTEQFKNAVQRIVNSTSV